MRNHGIGKRHRQLYYFEITFKNMQKQQQNTKVLEKMFYIWMDNAVPKAKGFQQISQYQI